VLDGAPAALLRPEAVREHFGVAVDTAITADGRAFLVPRAAAHSANEPSVAVRRIP
jgi:hypothetical protein